jgi:hypothetical protein
MGPSRTGLALQEERSVLLIEGPIKLEESIEGETWIIGCKLFFFVHRSLFMNR